MKLNSLSQFICIRYISTFFSIFNITKAFIKQCGEKQPCSNKTVNSAYAYGLQIISQRISSVNNEVNNDEKAWLQSPLESVLGTHTIYMAILPSHCHMMHVCGHKNNQEE